MKYFFSSKICFQILFSLLSVPLLYYCISLNYISVIIIVRGQNIYPVLHLLIFLFFDLVMRLTRPTLNSPLPVTCDTKDLPANLLNLALQQDITAVQGFETVSVGQFLLLPQSPVNIYLGETFSSYICVHNETKDIVRNVAVKVRQLD